jgi:hypothetical protein
VLSTKIDYEDYLNLKDINVKWSIVKNNKYGTLRVKAEINGKKVYLHRVILGCSDDMVVDHIDRDSLNNTRANLRVVSQKENTQNRPTKIHNYVYYDQRIKRYRVRYTEGNKKINLGSFINAEDAIKVIVQHLEK